MGFFVALCFAALLSSSFAAQYKITSYTGSRLWAGTDANVRLTLHGSRGTKTVTISSTGSGVLERNAVDTFTVNTDADLGDISSIDIQRDNSGSGPGWYLDKVDVKSVNGIREFPCGKWISSDGTTLKGQTCGRSKTASSRIVGGTQASKGAWPWQVTINAGGKHWCGGSIISDRWILSAAHCFVDDPAVNTYTTTVGQHDLSNSDGFEQTSAVKQIILHENYDENTHDYDLALLELTTPIQYNSRVGPVCMAITALNASTECYVTGWGALSEGGNGPNILNQAMVPLIDLQVCKNSYPPFMPVTDRMLCAGYASGGIDACQGDSGGPLVCRKNANSAWKLHGVVSWGVGCARPNQYGVYTNVVQLETWVLANILHS